MPEIREWSRKSFDGKEMAGPGTRALLGSLPVIADFCRRLDVRGIIDPACPARASHRHHGQVIEALVANRLLEDWAWSGLEGRKHE